MAGEKRPLRPVASPLRVSTAFGADRKAACAKVAKVAKKVAKVVKVVKVAKEFAKAPTGRSVKPGVKSVKLVIRRRVERVERVECTAENDTVQKALELYETLWLGGWKMWVLVLQGCFCAFLLEGSAKATLDIWKKDEEGTYYDFDIVEIQLNCILYLKVWKMPSETGDP